MEKLMIMVMLTFATIIMSHIPSLNSAKPPPPFALYVFGDSLFDSGNNNLLPTLAKANFYPYGMNFPGGATGRFTNGRTVVDFIAEFLGLPYAPPYESLLRAIPPLGQLTGLNFASGSCGIFDETGSKYGKCLSLVDQINFFEKIVQQDLPKYYQNSDELSNYLSKSLFIISSGSNDYLNNYIDILNKNSSSSVAKLLINKLSPQLERMYKLGARKVIMFEIGPIGCIPSVTRQFKHNSQCAEEVNKLAVTFNDQLAPMLQNLSSTLEGSDFVLGHANWLGYDAIINPSKYGLIDSTNPCCKSLLNGTSGCIPGLGALACDYPEKNYFWDGYHPTETVYKTIASLCFNGSSVCIPKSIAQLVLQA